MTDYPYVFVDSQAGLERAASALASCPRLYLDTEFESGRGPTRICLLHQRGLLLSYPTPRSGRRFIAHEASLQYVTTGSPWATQMVLPL